MVVCMALADGRGRAHGESNIRDERKAAENQRKHGVSFLLAQRAFLDPNRVIARDRKHSETEHRYYCIGRAGEGIVTVRFTYRGRVIRIIGAGYWRQGRRLYEQQNQIHE
jgi:uncharacterized protein